MGAPADPPAGSSVEGPQNYRELTELHFGHENGGLPTPHFSQREGGGWATASGCAKLLVCEPAQGSNLLQGAEKGCMALLKIVFGRGFDKGL